MSLADLEISLTEQLQRFSGGDREIAEDILRKVLPRLRQIAVGHLRRERYVAPVSPTELINEVWVKSLHKGGWRVRDREHFYSIAARAMRHALVDLARNRLAQVRGGGDIPASIDDLNGNHPVAASPEQVVEVGLLMEKLEARDAQWAEIMDLHYFAGFTLEETAEATGLTFRQVRSRWEKALNWLKDRMGA